MSFDVLDYVEIIAFAQIFVLKWIILNNSFYHICSLGFIWRQAIQLDPEFTKNIGKIIVLGGAFAVNGNVNPAAEANVSNC